MTFPEHGFDVRLYGETDEIRGQDSNLIKSINKSMEFVIEDDDTFHHTSIQVPHYNLDEEIFFENLVREYEKSGGKISLSTEYVSRRKIENQDNNLEILASNGGLGEPINTKLLIDASGANSQIQKYPKAYFEVPLVGGRLKLKNGLPKVKNSWHPILDKKGYFTDRTIFFSMDSILDGKLLNPDGTKTIDEDERSILTGWWVSPINKEEAIVYL